MFCNSRTHLSHVKQLLATTFEAGNEVIPQAMSTSFTFGRQIVKTDFAMYIAVESLYPPLVTSPSTSRFANVHCLVRTWLRKHSVESQLRSIFVVHSYFSVCEILQE